MHDRSMNTTNHNVILQLLNQMIFRYFHLNLWLWKNFIVFFKIILFIFLGGWCMSFVFLVCSFFYINRKDGKIYIIIELMNLLFLRVLDWIDSLSLPEAPTLSNGCPSSWPLDDVCALVFFLDDFLASLGKFELATPASIPSRFLT